MRRPCVHSGLTGRKTAIDTYGEYFRQSGSVLSGKGPICIDRIGTYASHYAGKNIVAAGLAGECEMQLGYSIAFARPVSVQVETFGMSGIPDDELARRIARCIDFRLVGIIRKFDLRHLPGKTEGGFYQKLAVYGRVGRIDLALPWEKTDKVQELLSP